jgi:low affinity Fe/Cu permease
MNLNELFRHFAQRASELTGTAWAFLLAVAAIIAWITTGPMFRFSDTWQLVINTGTTIVTFLMVFLIQNTQNRDAKALHLKLDELIRAQAGARNQLVDLEALTDDELSELQEQFRRFRENQSATGTTPDGAMAEMAEEAAGAIMEETQERAEDPALRTPA